MIPRVPPHGEYCRDEAHLAVYSRAACIYLRKPAGVLFPKSEEDLRWALNFCRQEGIPLTMRGGGSGLAGQSVGEGVVADVSRWMRKISAVDQDARELVAQPGAVLSHLNRAISNSGLVFAPDPSSQDFCTIGGMLANNSKGARSVKYGTTVAHVKKVRVVFADGNAATISDEYKQPEMYPTAQMREAASLIWDHRVEIASGWPRSNTNASGYNLRGCLPLSWVDGTPSVNLLPLFIGSEGTLCIFVDATLNLIKPPDCRALSMIEFDSVEAAGSAVVSMLPEGPSALEILDATFLDIIRRGFGAFPLPVRENTRAILLAESDGTTEEESNERMAELVRASAGSSPTRVTRAVSAFQKEAIWSFRKAASPLLNRGRGNLKSIRFIEDVAVPTGAIPAFLKGSGELLSINGIETVVFGHAGDGNFHINPFMDLKDPGHFALIPRIAEAMAHLLAGLGGSLSGEHGDGRLRTPYLHIIYGDLTRLFRQIKRIFDPEDLLNPGIIAPAYPEPIDLGIRYSPQYRRRPLPDGLSEDGWATEIERCHGCGTCRDFCPTAAATNHDLLSSRGRGHILQCLLSGELDWEDAAGRDIERIFESCLGCSKCQKNCPTGVDIAPLASLFRSQSRSLIQSWRDGFLGQLPSMGYRTGPGLGKALGAFASSAAGRLASRLAIGLRVDIKVPNMSGHFEFDPALLYRFPGTNGKKVAYFYGCYGNIYNPSGEAKLGVAVLSSLGFEVVVPPQACCGISKLSRGLIDQAAPDALFIQRSFEPWLEEGFEVVASSPSCLLALKRDHLLHFPGPAARSLSENIRGLFSAVQSFRKANPMIADRFEAVRLKAAYLSPCHAIAAETSADEVKVLSSIPGLNIAAVTTKCCGMAGSFGAEARNAEISDAIGSQLFDEIKASGVECVITPCGSCKTQAERYLQLPVLHPLTVLARALGIEAADDIKGLSVNRAW